MGRGRGGFGGMGDMMKLAKMAQKMQDDMMAAQQELEEARIEATSGGGMVKAIVTGKGKLVALEIKPEAVDPDDVEMLQDMILTAIKEAEEKAEAQEKERMEGLVPGGMGLPGIF